MKTEQNKVMSFPTFNLALGQILVECGKIEKNLERAEKTIHEASRKGCQIIVLPECLDVGWTHSSARQLAREIPGEISNRLCQAAENNKLMVVAGLTERENSRIYNSEILIDENGKILLKHRKINELTSQQMILILSVSLVAC